MGRKRIDPELKKVKVSVSISKCNKDRAEKLNINMSHVFERALIKEITEKENRLNKSN